MKKKNIKRKKGEDSNNDSDELIKYSSKKNKIIDDDGDDDGDDESNQENEMVFPHYFDKNMSVKEQKKIEGMIKDKYEDFFKKMQLNLNHAQVDEEEEGQEESNNGNDFDDDDDDENNEEVQDERQNGEIGDVPKEEAIEEIQYVPKKCVPIRCDVTRFDFDLLIEKAGMFDIVHMDPPWVLTGPNPSRGANLGYNQLKDNIISTLPMRDLQKDGLIFIWVINCKLSVGLKMLDNWGYEMITDISWAKSTVNRKLASGNGFYCQHRKETCLVGAKGFYLSKMRKDVRLSNVIMSIRREQSQKPEEIYELMEALIPNGKYLEIFGRTNNLRDYWVTIGNEL